MNEHYSLLKISIFLYFQRKKYIKEISEKKLVVCSSIKNVVTGLVRKEADIVETVRLKIFL
jgi:hypothetical protein